MYNLVVEDYDRHVYETEIKNFIPKKLFDFHIHVFRDDIEKYDRIKKKPKSWVSRITDELRIEQLRDTFAQLFPENDCKALIFGGTGRDLQETNDYVIKAGKELDYPTLYRTNSTMSGEELEENIKKGGFLGIKPYLSESPKYIPRKEIRIFDFVPHEHLKVCDKHGLIVMLHIPRDGRLKDPVNLHQILEIRKEFPKLRFIVAHIGRAYTKQDIGDAFDFLTSEPETMYDFSANCCEYAIEEVIKRCGIKHLMFGTDMPILRMRTRRIEESGTYINLVPPGMYPDPYGDPHLREVSEEDAKSITFFAYEELLSFKRVSQRLGLTKQDIEDIMYNNAASYIDDAKKSIYKKEDL